MSVSVTQNLVSKKNNFDLIRFIGAILVVWFHSFPLTGTGNELEFISKITNLQLTSGSLGVMIFFIISGFLITMSFERSHNLKRYIKARCLRIFPGYGMVILLSVFLLGPLISALSTREYFSDSLTWKYLLNIFLKNTQYTLPGVFTENIYPNAVNGSVWTLWYEFFFYIVVAVLGVTKLLNKKVSIALFALSWLGVFFNVSIGYYYVYFGMYFFAGMVTYLYRDKIMLSGKVTMIAILTIIIGNYFNVLLLILAISGTYLLFYLSLGPVKKFSNFSKYGDLSYGIYIYSFVIQQLLVYLWPNPMNQLENFIFTLPIVCLFAYLSWHLVEKPFMGLKDKTFLEFRKKEMKNE